MNHRVFLVTLSLILSAACARQEVSKLTVETEAALQSLIEDEDTDSDKKITKEDMGDKRFTLTGLSGKELEIESTYHLSNLLQELALARAKGKDTTTIDVSRIREKPADRISRNIRELYWDDLTRTIDEKGLSRILEDTKSSDTVTRRVYVPHGDTLAQKYFKQLESRFDNFKMEVLPEKVSPEYVKSINDQPGILSLEIRNGSGVPFVVPGGRFNEMYGWDSYFIGVGLLLDGRVEMARNMVDNFVYQIRNYGKILNANRSYYLTRTQPPFLSSFIRETYEALEEKDKDWLAYVLETAIAEYENVWMEEGVRLSPSGLNSYRAQGIGIPPETEAGHFDEILKWHTTRYNEEQSDFEKEGLSVDEYAGRYQSGEIVNRELDEYFLHDRSLRESGHDTSWRLDDICADLNTVGLNALLFKYEKDFQYLIATYFGGKFTDSRGKEYNSDYWSQKAGARRELMNRLMWNEEAGGFYDYNWVTEEMTDFESATNYYPLWAGLATPEQAESMLSRMNETLVAHCGVLSTSKESVQKYATNDIQRQWDYPNGWAPHQMMIWEGLDNYGYREKARELAYRWLWMITRNAVDYNGTIPEKYDVVDCTHKVYAEYGNVGTEFDYITTSGFGWMNASYQLGLEFLQKDQIESLNSLLEAEVVFPGE
ncbi:trehalase family glycosidase [Robertkochia aurantiaca]|uniref:trehalase family glycosidase n=1 Tax=Robertkochia aurantiaca TaxID=2873700 RepID=UPI001CCF1F4C|nr:trehalase family glycosidase [Robertkochia sp. 3YJGBD-33]